MVTSWNDWFMANNELGLQTKWDPENNVTQQVRSEIQDTYKAMRRIRGLEAKLAGQANSGSSSADWNLLLNLKRELGITNEMGTLEASLSGDGAVPAKAVAANM